MSENVVIRYRLRGVGLDEPVAILSLFETEFVFTKSSLETRLKNLKSGDYPHEVTLAVLEGWPCSEEG